MERCTPRASAVERVGTAAPSTASRFALNEVLRSATLREAALFRSVSRDHACLHLRLVHQINLAELAAREGSLIVATIELANVKALFQE